MFWLCWNKIQDKNKTKQNKAVSDSHPISGPICEPAACTGPVPVPERGGPITGVSKDQ